MITSTKNVKIKNIRELQAKKKKRNSTGSFVVEGIRLIEEALKACLIPLIVLYTEDLQERGMALVEKAVTLNAVVEVVMPHVMSAASDTKNSQGLLMVFPFPEIPEPEAVTSVLILDQLKDPGNMGTLLRSALAANIDSVWLTPGCVDPFSPKVVRAGMGAHFNLQIINRTFDEISSNLLDYRLVLFISEMKTGINYSEANLKQPSAIVIGSEAVGTSQQLLDLPHTKIHIPMPGKTESLNASAAGSVLLFEMVRQRNIKDNNS